MTIPTITFTVGLVDFDGEPSSVYLVDGNPLDNLTNAVSAVLAHHEIDGFTLREVTGMWKGNIEPSFEVVVSSDKLAPTEKIEAVAQDLGICFEQESVMWVRSFDAQFHETGIRDLESNPTQP
jgi:hypothetical protein